MSSCDKPSCILLAGGRGSRLHDTDKGLLEVNGRKLVEYALDSIIKHIDDIVISANRNHDRYRYYCPTVINDRPEWHRLGPLAGIASCLPYCQNELVLVTPCDIPFLPDSLTSTLLNHLHNHEVCAAVVGGRMQPVLLLRQSCLTDLGNALKRSELSLMKWIQKQSYTTARFDVAPPLFSNINTESELTRLAALTAHSSK